MKILQTPARFYPYIGGVENYVYYLSKELVKRGHEVKVVCANEPSGSDDIEGIKVKRLNYIGKIANTNITSSLPLRLLNEDFDIVHTHLPTPWSADWSAIVSAVKRRPLVLTYHNDIVGSGVAGHIAKIYNATALKFLLKRAEKIMVYHSKFSPHLQRYKEKIEIVPAGVDIERFHPENVQVKDTIFFLSLLDEFHKYKGLDYLLESLKEVKKEIPDVKLKVGGRGKLLDYYRRKADSLGLTGNVDFVGHVPDEEIPEYYRNCSVFVLPSISAAQEGFGMVLLEALASGRPVVTTDIVGVVDEIRAREAGRIVEPGDEKALSRAIVEILQNERLAKNMGRNGRDLVEEKYTWAKTADSLERVYLDLTD